MLEKYIRTDLALELKDNLKGINPLEGIEIHETKNKKHGIICTHIRVVDDIGKQNLGKPIGNYVTIESEKLCSDDESIHEPIVEQVHEVLKHLIHGVKKILVIGLGNRNVTPDALGPIVVDHLYITRHLLREGIVKNAIELAALTPGVMAQTGIETSTIIKSLCAEIKPDVVICVDALAARDAERLNTTIQICDTGITPGAGVGNRRLTLDKETLGVPVVAIGVPTVISMPAIIQQAMNKMICRIPDSLLNQCEDEILSVLHDDAISGMFVTPKNIDEWIRKVSFTISEAINRLLT